MSKSVTTDMTIFFPFVSRSIGKKHIFESPDDHEKKEAEEGLTGFELSNFSKKALPYNYDTRYPRLLY